MKEGNLYRFVAIVRKYLQTKSIDTVVELGARDCKESLGFYNLLHPKKIYTFECNPSTLPICRERVKGIKSIHLIERAVCNKNGKIKFYPIDQENTITTWKDGNPGASSLFKASGKYPIEKYAQKEIEVEAIKLKSFFKKTNISKVDVLWMDIQGAELLALQGLGDRIHDIKFIYTEVEFFEVYKDQPLYKDVKSFLDKKGFVLLGFSNLSQYAGDAIFINKQAINSNLKIFKILLWGDKDLLWNKYRPTFLLKAFHFSSRVYWKIQSIILKYLYLQSWKKRLINFHDQFGIEVNVGLKKHPPSKMKIDVVIPAADKDIEVLPCCIKSIRKYVKHPINKIFIISTKTDEIKKICGINDCVFIDEDTVLPISKRNIKYKVGLKDRSGWLFQQLLKLSGDKISILDNYLIVDADTVYIRPRVFEQNNKTVFDISDEYHHSYFTTYKKLLGSDVFLPASFTNHNMLINVPVLKELKKKIEKRCKLKWYKAILKNINKKEASFISEQETYGTYMFQNYRRRMVLEYWYNLSLKRTKINKIEKLTRTLSPFYKSISFHSYYK